jgi:prepilin-type N-terminal cleavage/methylation domain-containing protein
MRRSRAKGFTLIEILLVLAILGIISAIAIPAYLGQRHRARMIGIVSTNARILTMQLEQFKADQGVYGPAGATAAWASGSAVPTLAGFTTNPCPGFNPTTSTSSTNRMDYSLRVGPNGLSYVLDVNDASVAARPLIYQMDHTGRVLFQIPN